MVLLCQGNLTHLVNLNVSENQLADLPTTLGSCSRLRCLNVAANALELLPEDIGALPELQQIDLR